MQLLSSQLFVTAFILLLIPPNVAGNSAFKPYILAQDNTPMDSASVQQKLQTAGFDVLGTFSPAQGYETVAFTHPELKKEASKASVPMGAVLRASLVRNGEKTELSYSDPHYWAYASGLEGKAVSLIAQQLESALGKEKGFGSAKGMNEKTLRSYQYMFGMPRLTDLDQLGKYKTFSEATEAVAKGLEASTKVKEVYSLDIDASTRVVGVSVLDPSGSESTILGVADGGDGPKLGGLYGPYEIFIKGGEVSTTRGRFRIALAFPDLTMGTFMQIVAAPGAILDSLKSTTAQCAA